MYSSPIRVHDGWMDINVTIIGGSPTKHSIRISSQVSMEDFFEKVLSKLHIRLFLFLS